MNDLLFGPLTGTPRPLYGPLGYLLLHERRVFTVVVTLGIAEQSIPGDCLYTQVL